MNLITNFIFVVKMLSVKINKIPVYPYKLAKLNCIKSDEY